MSARKFKNEIAKLIEERDQAERNAGYNLELFNHELKKNTVILRVLHEFDQKLSKHIWLTKKDVRIMIEEIGRVLR